MKYSKLLMLPILALYSSCSFSQDKIDANEFEKKLAETPNAILLDVRTPEEIAKGHLKNASYIDFNDASFSKKIATIDKDKPVFVYCAVGGRSGKAAAELRKLGVKNVYDLKGGFISWKLQNKPYVNNEVVPSEKQLSKADFETPIPTNKITLVDFYAPWCGPCKIMVPALAEIEKEMKDSVNIIKVNADENLGLMKAYNFDELPYVMLFEGRALVYRQAGFMSKNDMKALVRKHLKASK
jgi:thioredoxin 1